MKSIISEIYNGKRGWYEKVETTEEYWNIHDEAGKLMDELSAVLDDKHKRLLNKLFITCGGLEGEIAQAHYIEGFKIGLLLGREVFSED